MKLELTDIGTGIALLGAILVSQGMPLYANLVWLVSNSIFVCHFHKNGDKVGLKLFAMYIAICVYGIINLGLLQ